MKRSLLTLSAALALATAATPTRAPAVPSAEACQDRCAEGAAQTCQRIDSWYCDIYIIGCLAGCGLS